MNSKLLFAKVIKSDRIGKQSFMGLEVCIQKFNRNSGKSLRGHLLSRPWSILGSGLLWINYYYSLARNKKVAAIFRC